MLDEGLLLVPTKSVREGWAEAIEQAVATHGSDLIDSEWLDASLMTDGNVGYTFYRE
jgi:hypothetical protein